jgi:N-acetylmuramoyl-L-alanine amidase
MKKPVKIVALLAAAACFAFALPKNDSKKIEVVIDAAHGGKDFGSAHDNFLEKEIAQSIAGKIKELNDDREIVIHFTRLGDEFVSLEERVETINRIKPDLVLSLHLNYAKGNSPSGVEIFTSKKSDQREQSNIYVKQLADVFQANKFEVRKVEEAPFYILNKSEVPAITIEMGYLSSETDRNYLTNEKGQETIANTIVDFLKEIK